MISHFAPCYPMLYNGITVYTESNIMIVRPTPGNHAVVTVRLGLNLLKPNWIDMDTEPGIAAEPTEGIDLSNLARVYLREELFNSSVASHHAG